MGHRPLSLTASTKPIITYSIIGVTVFVFLLQLIPGWNVTNTLLYSPVYSDPQTGFPFQPWRLITSAFVHSTSFYLHVLLNMYTLLVFGQILERMIGASRFLALYLISALAGSVGVLLLAPPMTAVVGASGAIFGLMGAFLVIHRHVGGNPTQLFFLIAINVVIGFLPGLNISWQAHLGGLAVGLVVGLVFVKTKDRSQRRLQLFLLLGVVFALFAVAALRVLV